MNSIPTTQNAEAQLEKLGAQRQLYQDAKTILAWQMWFNIPLAIAFAYSALFFPDWKVFAASYGIGMTCLDVLAISPRVKFLQKQAAAIQEAFDCEVLELEWPSLIAGRQPDPETILHYWRRYKRQKKDPRLLSDWYPKEVGALDLEVARLICQRANCWWDMSQRRAYSVASGIFAILLIVEVVAVGLLNQLKISDALLIMAVPSLPAFVFALRSYREQSEAADALDQLKSAVEKTWEKAVLGVLSASELTNEARRIQDQIFNNRKRNPLVFERLYDLFRSEKESEMIRGATSYVDEYVVAAQKRGERVD